MGRAEREDCVLRVRENEGSGARGRGRGESEGSTKVGSASS